MLRICLLFVLLSSGLAARAQDGVERRPLFEDDSPLAITIEGPLRQLVRQRRDRPELEGVVRYTDAGGDEIVLDVELTSRGNSRLEICSFPPMWLNFRRGQLDGTVFAGQNRLKLVTLCQERDSYRDYLAQEYQLYRAYNALTDHSFRVRWLTIEYVETDGRRPSTTIEGGFLIEEDWEVAERAGMEVPDVDGIAVEQLDPAGAALLFVFQYMIGNTDWSPRSALPGESCCHNTKLIAPLGAEGGHIVLPYDFDQVGLINTQYAEPPAGLGIRSVTQRLYRGYCVLNPEIDAAVELLLTRRAAVEAAFAFPDVGDSRRERAARYLAESYDLIGDPEALQSNVVDDCR